MSEHRIHFAGDRDVYQRVIKEPRQMVTVRSERKPFNDGDIVNATFDHSPADKIHVITQREQQIKDIHPGLLLLDGFLTPHTVLEMLNHFYEQKGPWQLNSSVARTLFVPAWMDKQLSPLEQMKLYYGPAYYEDPNFEPKLLKDSSFGNLFFYAFYYWLIEYHHLPVENYPAELQARDLVDKDRAKGMSELLELTLAAGKKRGKKATEEVKFYTHHFMIGDTAQEVK